MKHPFIITGLMLAFLILPVTLGTSGCISSPPEKTAVRVLCAGSLMIPFNQIEDKFEALNPDVDIEIEGHGSIQVIRRVTELDELSDIVAVADHYLIPLLMYQTRIPGSDTSYADWYVKFATNSIGIAYSPDSRYADEINADNWHEILSRPDVRIGVSDPRLDPCGYRALMLCRLAEDYYQQPGIFESVFGSFNLPVTMTEADGVTILSLPEIMRPGDGRIIFRGSSVWLIPLLEAGDADYVFEYESVARQHGVDFLELPPQINLSQTEYADNYGTVSCKLDFQRFNSVDPEFIGQPIIYAMTIPNNAPHPEIAEAFIKFVTGPSGQRRFTDNYHPQLTQLKADRPENIPGGLADILSDTTE